MSEGEIGTKGVPVTNLDVVTRVLHEFFTDGPNCLTLQTGFVVLISDVLNYIKIRLKMKVDQYFFIGIRSYTDKSVSETGVRHSTGL